MSAIILAQIQDFLRLVIPQQQQGFVQGRSMIDLVIRARAGWEEGRQGVWVSPYFRKVFHSVNHTFLEALFIYCQLPAMYIKVLLAMLKGPVRFLVGREVQEPQVEVGGGGTTRGPTVTVPLCLGHNSAYYSAS